MFCGFKSRWSTLWACANETASQIFWKVRKLSSRPLAAAVSIQALSLYQLHGVKDAAIGQTADIMYRNNAGMLQPGDDFRLAQYRVRTPRWNPPCGSL